MTLKSILFSTLLIVSTWANADEKGIQCSYKLFNSTGQQVSKGTFAIRTGHTNTVTIQNNISPLDTFKLAVEEHFQAGQDSSNTTYMLKGMPISKSKGAYFTSSPSDEYQEFFVEDMSVLGLHFGDKKTHGVITMEKPQSYYFMNADELILLRHGYEDHDLYKEILAKDGSCVGGNLPQAANYIRKHSAPYSQESVVQDEDSIEWTEVIEECAVWSDESHEMGGRICAEWKEVRRRQIVLPKCLN